MAREQIPAAAQAQLQQLTYLQGQRPLTPDEQAQLGALRQEYGPYDPLESACLRFTESTQKKTHPQSGLVPRHEISLTSHPRQDRFCCALPL